MAKSNRRGRGEGLGSVPSRTLGPLPGQAVLCSADLGAGGQGPGGHPWERWAGQARPGPLEMERVFQELRGEVLPGNLLSVT